MKAALQTQDVEEALAADKKLRHKLMLSLVKYAPYARYTTRRNKMSMGDRLKQHIIGDGILTSKMNFNHIPWEKLAWQLIMQERAESVIKRMLEYTRRNRTK